MEIARSSIRNRLKTAASICVLTLLAGCSGVAVPQSSMNIHGDGVSENDKSRVERLVRYCEKIATAGDHTMAMGLCNRAYQLDPSNPLPLAILAESLKAVGQHDEAALAYQKILESHPDNADAHYLLGKNFVDMGDLAAAKKSLSIALAVAPNDARLHNLTGVLQDQEGNHEVAQFHYREALAIEPDNLSVASNLGLSLALSGQRDEAIALLNKVVSDPEASDVSHHNLALAYASEAAPVQNQAAEAPAAVPVAAVEAAPLTASAPPSDSRAPITPAPIETSEAVDLGAPDKPYVKPAFVGRVEATPQERPEERQVAALPRADGPPVSLLASATASVDDAVWDVAPTMEETEWESAPQADRLANWLEFLANQRREN